MHIGKRGLVGLALAGLLALGGCSGSSEDATFGGSVIAPGGGASTAPTAQRATFTIPVSGGTVELPNSGDITGKITFAPGAQADTQMTVSVSETPVPGAIPVPVQSGLTYRPFWYMTVQVDRPFDLALIQSITLTDHPNNVASIASTHEQYNMPVAEVGGAVHHHLDGEFDPVTASFYNAKSLQMQAGKSYIMQAQGIDHPTMQLTMKNDSEFPYAYFAVVGQDVITGKRVWLDAGGQLNVCKKEDWIADTINTPAQYGYCQYSHPFTSTGTNITLPLINAARIYMCLTNTPPATVNASIANNTAKGLDEVLLIRTDNQSTGMVITPPVGYVNQDRNYKVLFDFSEFTYLMGDTPSGQQPILGINKSDVDSFGIGFQMTLTSKNGTVQTTGTNSTGRKPVIDELDANPTFKTLLVSAANTAIGNTTPGLKYLRAAAPKLGIQNKLNNDLLSPTFPPDYLDAYITQVWNNYKTNKLTVFTSAFGTYTGQVDANDNFVFTNNEPGYPQFFMKKWSTIQAFESTDVLAKNTFYSPSPGASPIPVPPPPAEKPNKENNTSFAASETISGMCAAFNRTTLMVEDFVTRDYSLHPATLSKFYNETRDGGVTPQPVNHYAKSIHKHALPTKDAPGTPPSGGAAYAFGFDDSNNQSSYISDPNSPPSIQITVGKVMQQ